jgi:hypothetical protein
VTLRQDDQQRDREHDSKSDRDDRGEASALEDESGDDREHEQRQGELERLLEDAAAPARLASCR